jgi:hypothetical protein
MALNWDWKKRIGTATIFNYDKEVEYSLYQGNAFLIMLYEYKEDGEDMWQMHNFLVDKEHAKNCFGLSKGYTDNIFNTDKYQLRKIEIDGGKYRYTKELVDMLLKAFDNIEIKITKGGN